MKKLIYIALVALASLASCTRYDDSEIREQLRDHEERIQNLESICRQLNSNIEAVQTILEVLESNYYVTEISKITEKGIEIGYTISFSNGETITIYHGKDGTDGEDGKDGLDGAPGKDGHTPVIGVRQYEDGVYYWTLDGEWLLDDAGNKIPTTGKDGSDGAPGTPGSDGRPGSDGQDGTDGKDGITPLLKIEDDYWYISYDEGATWTKLYKAVGEDGKDGEDGKPGQDGTSGDSFFSSIDTSDPDYIIITLSDGSEIKLPTWKAFEELQTAVNKLNTNVSALQSIVSALQEQDYVTGVSPITENGHEVGYTICFSQSLPVTIYHGKDGSDGLPGTDGKPGVDGRPGQDGKDGYTPVIGVKQGTSDEDWTLDDSWVGESNGLQYYWTIDGEWLLDEDGHRIPATGRNGSEGASGGNGATPKLKIEDGQWYISLDGGKTWQQEPLGPATSSEPDNTFSEITYDDQYLYITLPDGENIILSRHKENPSISCDIESLEVAMNKARFIGTLGIPSEEVRYSLVTIYYSEDKDFNIYLSKSVSTASFDYNNSFKLVLNDLKPGTQYYYCICTKIRSNEIFGPTKEFITNTSEGASSYIEFIEEDFEIGAYDQAGNPVVMNNCFRTKTTKVFGRDVILTGVTLLGESNPCEIRCLTYENGKVKTISDWTTTLTIPASTEFNLVLRKKSGGPVKSEATIVAVPEGATKLYINTLISEKDVTSIKVDDKKIRGEEFTDGLYFYGNTGEELMSITYATKAAGFGPVSVTSESSVVMVIFMQATVGYVFTDDNNTIVSICAGNHFATKNYNPLEFFTYEIKYH